ncbi:hypothetical protein A2U01_0004963, partial [Trifolium medium]|nr:hypothetical protein [Trifolium medium]
FLPFLEPILEPESVCETKMVDTVTSTCDVDDDDDVGKLAITGVVLGDSWNNN